MPVMPVAAILGKAKRTPMFKITGPGLSRVELAAAKSAAARKTPFPEYDRKSQIGAREWIKVREIWEAFKGEVRNPDKFCLAYPLGGDSEDDTQYAVIHYRASAKAGRKLRVTLEDEHSIQEYEELFPIIKTAETIRAGMSVRPNQKCPCGSGKKSKRCCGNS